MLIEDFTAANFSFINYTHCSLDLHVEILHLRNSEAIRRWMVDQNIIAAENHFRFVDSLRERNDRFYFAVIEQNKLVASINISRESESTWERGIFVSPRCAGSGQTTIIESFFNNRLKLKGVETLTAKVKTDNLRSIRYHEKMGYRQVTHDDDYIYYKLEL